MSTCSVHVRRLIGVKTCYALAHQRSSSVICYRDVHGRTELTHTHTHTAAPPHCWSPRLLFHCNVTDSRRQTHHNRKLPFAPNTNTKQKTFITICEITNSHKDWRLFANETERDSINYVSFMIHIVFTRFLGTRRWYIGAESQENKCDYGCTPPCTDSTCV